MNQEEVVSVFKESDSYSEAARKLGIKHFNGQTVKRLKKLIQDYKIDISHFDFGKKRQKELQLKYEIVEKSCPVCGNKFKAQKNHPREKQTCSISCSNRFFRPERTEEQKRKISESLLRFNHKTPGELKIALQNQTSVCLICNKRFKHQPHKNRICCSRRCGQIHQFGSLPYTKEEVLSKLTLAIQEKQRLPTTKEIEKKLYTAIKRFFGTWNCLIKQLGFEPNKQFITRRRIACEDGHLADSISEKIVDDWLFKNNIKHERNHRYPDRKMTCDFYIPDKDIWIEYFGLYGENRKYDEAVEEKREIAKQNKIKLIELFKEDLYPKIRIQEKTGDVV